MAKVSLFHGSPVPPDIILDEGLKCGNNSHGGTHGIYSPRICLTTTRETAMRYGEYIYLVLIEENALFHDCDRNGTFFYVDEDVSADVIFDVTDEE